MSAELDELKMSCVKLGVIYRAAAAIDTEDLGPAYGAADLVALHIQEVYDGLRRTPEAEEAEAIVGRTLAVVTAFNQYVVRPMHTPRCWN